MEEWIHEWPRGVKEKRDGVGDERVTEEMVYAFLKWWVEEWPKE